MITPDIVEPYAYSVHDYRVYSAGRRLYLDGRVLKIDYQDEVVICEGKDGGDFFSVKITQVGNKGLQMECGCDESAMVPICRHEMASLWALSAYLRSPEMQANWSYRLYTALQAEGPKSTRPSKTPNRYAVALFLRKNQYYYQELYNLDPYVIRASKWKEIQQFSPGDDPEIVLQFLEKNPSWTNLATVPNQVLKAGGCVNLTPEGVSAFNSLILQNRTMGITPNFSVILPMLIYFGIPIFFEPKPRKLVRIQLVDTPLEMEAAIQNKGDHITLQIGTTLDEKKFTTSKGDIQVIFDDPPWVLVGTILAPLSNPQALQILNAFPLNIPLAEEEKFRAKFLPVISKRMPVKGDMVQWEDVNEATVPRLYLRKDASTLRAELRFGYGETEIAAERNPETPMMVNKADSWVLTRIIRDIDREEACYQMLADPKFGLKRSSSPNPYGSFEMRARVHPYDFLVKSIPALTKAGFEIFGDKDTLGKINPNKPALHVNLTSGINWFELETFVLYGDQQVQLREIRKVLRRGEQYIRLADGSIGQIPEDWLSRYRHLFAIAEERDGNLRISDLQLPLVDQLIEDAEQAEVAPAFYEKRQRMAEFQQIQPQALPEGLNGQLRPYQKAGLDWLHFLHQYGFGGILADDMGLGKTIQVLALLQSLAERGELKAGALLVVPKSLLSNWQREAARFTPGLRISGIRGGKRVKDQVIFAGYDLVLTTYGTMLKDVALLRDYRFDYIVLDESQAIKNPLAQSAKAARLLNADHRLAMTGTPVENNTFELWSQFAFLNPGLLGTMDSFRHEFVAPIEIDKDEASADLLRRLVFPFILRRTKAQVAPELPERTERVIYTDLEPAQLKLYNRTRDYFRAELLGMIEESGLDNTRMKILEGLLRLRQICIHPRLVDPAYNKPAAKFEILLETLETLRSEGHKALIFSQFVQSLRLLAAEMDHLKLPYIYLDGKTNNRQERVDRFQEDPALTFFLISLKAGGVGLNLTAADYVIHLDPWWNPAVEIQAADRAHRIGQDKPVFIYKLIARGTVEEKILELQEQKRSLVEKLISSESGFFKSLTRDDVKDLFS